MDIIIEYIINNFNYDVEVDSKELSNDEIGEMYYSKGYLTAALEDEKQVCGNYASMVYILCREANIECYNLSNDIHAWNAVKVDDKFYYIDVTYIDSDYEKKYNNEYSFKMSEHYMMEPIYISDKIYNLNALPPGLEIKKIPPKVDYIYRNNDNKDLKKDIIKISNNGNSYYVHPISFLENSAMFSLTFTITFKVLIIINKKLGIIKNNEKVKKKK